MDNIRLILFIALAFILFSLYEAWQQDYGPAAVPGEPTAASPASPAAVDSASAVPDVRQPDGVPVAPATGPAIGAGATVAAATSKVKVKTDVLEVEIDTLGGTISSARLRAFPVEIDKPDQPLTLYTSEPAGFFIAQSGLIGSAEGTAPAHDAVYVAERTEYVLADGEDNLTVTLSWQADSGVEVRKHFHFSRDSYSVRVEHEVLNHGESAWAGRSYGQLQRVKPAESGNSAFMYTYTGGAIYSPDDKYKKVDFDKMREETLSRDVAGGWVAMLQHYFVSAWIPPADRTEHFYTKVLPGERFVIGSYSPAITVEPGASHVFSSELFAGPKLQTHLEAVAPGLVLTRDYGWLAVIAQPMFWVLDRIHKLVNNWGWAIILFTILLKLALYPLSAASYKSMAGMRKLGPRIQALKDRYGDDKQRMQQAMMEMYRKEKINPLGGCLPMLIQIPFFIALYWVLLESVELRQAPWILWIVDLSVKDPYYVLPILMGVTMFVQQKLNPAPPDPMQAKIMMSLPFVFTVFFAFFPAGLVLYWFVNNLFSIAQQWYITRSLEKAAP